MSKQQMKNADQRDGQMSLFDQEDTSAVVQGATESLEGQPKEPAVEPFAADRADAVMETTVEVQCDVPVACPEREESQPDTELTGEVESNQALEQHASERPVTKIKIPCSLSSSTMMQLLLYRGSGSVYEYRARLKWAGSKSKASYAEHYCSNVKEAQAWAKSAGEEALIARSSIAEFGDYVPGIRLRLVVQTLNLDEGSGVKAFFDAYPELLTELSKKPITEMTAAEFGRGIYAAVGEQGERIVQEAVRVVNTVLDMCQTYGIIHRRIHIYRNIKKHDKYYKAMRASLSPRVMPEWLCSKIYSTCVGRLESNDYYLMGVIELKMGLALGELAALKYEDIGGVDDPPLEGDAWSMPVSDVWTLCIRRFYRKKTEDGRQTYVLTTATSAYKYRRIAIPPDLKEVLKQYIQRKGTAVSGKSWLVSAHKGGGGIQPEVARRFLQKLLVECDVKKALMRELLVPRKDDVSEDKKLKLEPDINIFRHNVLYYLKEQCEAEEHVARAYLGLPPFAVIDKHYWERNDTMSLLRSHALISRWDLRRSPLDQIPVPESQTLKAEQGSMEFPAPIGYTTEVNIMLRGARGKAMNLDLWAKYGIDCHYTVTHDEEDP